MQLKEAFERANDGDKVYCGVTQGNFCVIKRDGKTPKHIQLSVKAALSDQWQIIPGDPKVLNASEIRTKVTHEDPNNTESYRKLMYVCAEYGIENGQLKEWLNHKELRETVEDFTQQLIGFLSPSIVREYRDRFKALLDELKAPND